MVAKRRFRSCGKPWMKKLALIVVAALMIPALGTAQQGKKWKINLSVFTAKVSRTEFVNSFATDGSEIWLFESGDGSEGFILNSSKGGLGFSLGFSYDVTSFVGFGSGNGAVMAYAEFTLAPSFAYADIPEREHQYAWDESTDSYLENRHERVQSGRKVSLYGLTLGAVILPFARIPVSLDLNGGLWRWRLEYVSGTSLLYGSSLGTAFLEEYLGSEYKGNGKWEKDILGFVVGAGLRFTFLKHLSLDLMAKFPLMTTRRAWTGLVNLYGDPIRSNVSRAGTILGIGLSAYY